MTTHQMDSGVRLCALLLLQYVPNRLNLLERLLRDTLKSSTDDGIQQFTDSFADLRQRFAEGSNIIMSNHIRNLESGIVELQELGEIFCKSINLQDEAHYS
jgi:hypothetical protein